MVEIIAKGAVIPENFSSPKLYYSSAREGFADALEAILTADNRRVLLPAFIGWSPREGSGVFDPVKGVGGSPCFYEPRSDLTLDVSVFEERILEFKPRVAVVIGYFGRTDPNLREIGKVARDNNVILVEDLAHGFFSFLHGGRAGTEGALSLFSMHKMFPVDSGGLVLYRELKLLKLQRGTASGLAERILDYNWLGISERRIANFNSLMLELSKLDYAGERFEFMWGSLEGGDVPQTLPVRLNGVDRDAVYHAMNADGYGMTSLYHTMISEVRDEFSNMVSLANSIINFPVHQDMFPGEAKDMVASFDRAVRKFRAS